MPTESQKEQLKHFAEAYKVFTQSFTKQEFLEAFKKVIDFIKEMQKKNAEEMARLASMYEGMMQKMKEDSSDMMTKDMTDMKKRMIEMCRPMMKEMEDEMKKMAGEHDEMMKEHQEEMNYIYDRVRRIESGKDGKDGKDGSPDTPKEIRGKLEVLKGDERLDKSAIKGLEEEIENLKKENTRLASRPTGRLGMKKITSVRSIDLTSYVDGGTSTFTLPNDTLKVLGVWSTQFPITFRDGTDWTFAGRTLTLVTTQVGVPQSGQTLWALIETAFYA